MVIIIAILASISIATYRTYIKKAIVAEAMIGLAAIRAGEQAYYAEHNTYVSVQYFGDSVVLPGVARGDPAVNNDGALDGTYLSENCYLVVANDPFWAGSFDARCIFNMGYNTSPKADYVNGLFPEPAYLALDEKGQFRQAGIPESGFPES